MNDITKRAIMNAGATGTYIVTIAFFLSRTAQIFGPDEPKTPLVPMFMLSLLVFSAALVGSLIFGQPILWYWDGRKREALKLLTATLATFLLFTTAMAFLLYFSR